jgi:LysM repeat protein
MRSRTRFAFALIFAAIFVVALALPASAQSFVTVVVQRGDTLSKIAARNCTTWQAIYNINQATIGPNPSNVQPGMVLTVPNHCGGGGGGGGTGGVVDSGPRVHATGTFRAPHYTVAWGDTLTSIGVRFGTTARAIQQANGLTGSTIRPGQVLVIPGAGTVLPPPIGGGSWSGAERVTFSPGATAATRTGTIVNGQARSFVLAARAGQTMEVWTNSFSEPLRVTIVAATDVPLQVSGTNGMVSNYSVTVLPSTTDYLVSVAPAVLPENPQIGFNITISIR